MAKESLIVYIDSEAKKVLREAGKADDRKLSPFCARILEAKARELEKPKRGKG